MESTPDSGVEIKKAVVAPLLAPCFCSDTAAGRTPHDHNGIGIPSKAALKTEAIRPLPKCLATVLGLRKTRSSPLTRRPKMIYMEASRNSCQASINGLMKIDINVFPLFFIHEYDPDRCSKNRQYVDHPKNNTALGHRGGF